jgi:hypothetical protein
MSLHRLRRHALPSAASAAVIVVLGAGAAVADCKDDLVASQQGLKATRAGIEQVAAGPEAAKCPAHRRHYAAMIKFRDVLGRCDTGSSRAGNLTQLNTSIDDFRKKMPAGCKP